MDTALTNEDRIRELEIRLSYLEGNLMARLSGVPMRIDEHARRDQVLAEVETRLALLEDQAKHHESRRQRLWVTVPSVIIASLLTYLLARVR